MEKTSWNDRVRSEL